MESKWNETFRRVIFGTEAIQGTWSARKGSNVEGTRQGGAPSTLVGSPGLFWPNSFTLGLLLVLKISSKIGTSIGLRLVFLFCETLKEAKKIETGTGL